MKIRVSQRPPWKWMGWILVGLLTTTVTFSALWTPTSLVLPALSPKGPSTVLTARIKPVQSFTINAEFPGKVTSVQVAPGAEVKAGETLAVLESEELAEQWERAQRRYKFVQNRLAAARAAEGKNRRARIEREQLETAARARQAARERLRAYSVADAEKAHADAKARLTQLRSLMEQQLATRAEAEESQAQEQAAGRNLQAAREHWSRLKQEADAAESQLRLSRMQSSTAGGELLNAQLELEEAKEALRAASARMFNQFVTAPRAGTILRVSLQAGDRVTSGTPLFQIADLSKLTFEVPVSAKVAQHISPGSSVAVRVPTEPPIRVAAEVSSVMLVPDQDRQFYLVQVTIPNPNRAAILAGLEGAVEFPHLDSSLTRQRSF